MNRPVCNVCHKKPVAVNYKRGDKTYYRKKCDSCIRSGRGIKPPKPLWAEAGYKKKLVCDRCGFKARWLDQLAVYYIDGNMNNTKQHNLRSVCLNCTVVIEKQDMPWAKDISPDF